MRDSSPTLEEGVFSRQNDKKAKVSATAAARAHKLRMQRQAEAKARGMSYGQYVALFGGEIIVGEDFEQQKKPLGILTN